MCQEQKKENIVFESRLVYIKAIHTMAKRRTKKEKLKVNYSFIFDPKGIYTKNGKNLVKSQLNQNPENEKKKNILKENPINTERQKSINLIKRDVVKSLGLTALILGLELVLYFVWNKN